MVQSGVTFSLTSLPYSSEQLKGQLESQLSGTRERLMTMELEFENLNDDRVRYLDEIDKLKRQLQSAQQDKEAAQRKYNKQVCGQDMRSDFVL